MALIKRGIGKISHIIHTSDEELDEETKKEALYIGKAKLTKKSSDDKKEDKEGK